MTRICSTASAIAAADPRVGAARRARVHGARRTAAGPRHRARRRRSGVGDLRPQQGAQPAPSPGCGSICSACRRRRRSTSCWRSSRGSTPATVHDGILVQSPLPAAMGRGRRAARVRRHRSGQGRRRLPPGQRRPARAGARAPGAVHAVRRHRDARSERHRRSPGAHAVVIGRSEIVGKPMAMLLLQRDATVTICHSKTPDLAGAWRRPADILVAAIGRPGFVTRGLRQAGRDGHRRRHQPR